MPVEAGNFLVSPECKSLLTVDQRRLESNVKFTRNMVSSRAVYESVRTTTGSRVRHSVGFFATTTPDALETSLPSLRGNGLGRQPFRRYFLRLPSNGLQRSEFVQQVGDDGLQLNDLRG